MTIEQEIGSELAEQLDRLYARKAGRALLETVEGGSWPGALWAEIEALGLPLSTVGEARGGAGLGWRAIEPLLRASGRHASPLPLAECVLANALIDEAGGSIADAATGILLGDFELDAHDRVHGHGEPLSALPGLARVVLSARRGHQTLLCVLDTATLASTPLHSLSRVPTGAVRLDRATPLAVLGAMDVESLRVKLALARALEMAGALEQVLALCVEHAGTRQQFGKPLARQQAVQHHLSELGMQTAATLVAVQFGCRSADAGQLLRGAAVAKARAGMAAGICVAAAHQVFGAVGFTDEHALHFFTRRLLQWRGEAGSELYWSERLGEQACRAGGAALWPAITG